MSDYSYGTSDPTSTYFNQGHNPVQNGFANDNLQCNWENTSGRCGAEVDFIVTFGPPPCGHDFAGGQIGRFCGRHMLRVMFTLMTKQRCGVCGSEYQGIAILRSTQRL